MKKTLLSLRFLALFCGTCLCSYGDRLELLEFDDPAATDVTAAANTGLPGVLAHPAHATNTYETNGGGQAVFTSDGTDVFTTSSLGSTNSTGKIFLRVDYAGHTLTDTANDGVFAYGLRDSSSLSQLNVRLVKIADSTTIRLSVSDLIDGPGNDTFNAAAVDYAGLTDSAGVGTILALDLDSRTYDFYTDIGLTGTFTKELSNIALGDLGGLMSVENVDQLRFFVQNLPSGDAVTVNQVACADNLTTALRGDSVIQATDLYEFNDPPGTVFTSASNSGTETANTLPSFGAPGNTFETNGAGQAIYTGNGSNVFIGSTISTVSADEVFLRADFAGHDWASSGNQKQFGFGFGNAGTGSSSELLLRIVKTNTDSIRIQAVDVDKATGGGTINTPQNANINYAGLSDTTGIATILAYNITAGTYSVYTDVGFSGTFVKVLSDIALNNSASLAQVDRLRMREQNLAGTDTVSVERIAYSTDLEDVLLGSTLSLNVDELFEFGGAAATAVESTDNTGSVANFNHPVYGANTFEANGSGQAVFTSTGAATFQTRPLASTVSSGKLFLRADFAGHDFATSSNTAVFGYGLRNSATNSQLIVRLTKFKNNDGTTPENIRISVQDSDGSGTTASNFTAVNAGYTGLTDSVGIGTLLALDLDANTYDLYTDVGMTGAYTQLITAEPLITTGAASGAHLDDIDQFRFLSQFMTSGDTVTMERVALDDNLANILGDSVVPLLIDQFHDETATFLGLADANAANGFTICGDGITSYSSPDGSSFFRTGALAVPSGKVFLRMDLSEYTTTENSFDNFQLGLRDADGDLVSLQLAGFSSGDAKRIRTVTTVAGAGIDITTVFGVPNLGDAFAPSVILEVDIDNDTYGAWMEAPDGTWLCVVGPAPFQDGAASPVDIGPITQVRLGIQAMEVTDVIGIDFVGISSDLESLSAFVPNNPVVSKGGDIVITDSGISGGNFVASFSSSSNVDVYSSTDLQDFGASPILTDVAPGTDVVFEAAGALRKFYLLVPTGSPAP